MKRILVPIDFSEESMNALDAAHNLALDTNSDVLLLHIVEDPNVDSMEVSGEDHYDPMDNVYVKLLLDKTKEKLEAIVNDPKMNDLNISYKIDVGNPYSSIAENIASHEASLIFMGSQGATGLEEVLVGSVADKTVRYAKCPVIVVKNKCEMRNISDIVYATDLNEDHGQIIDDLKEIQAHFGAKLHLIKVFDSQWTTVPEVKKRADEFVDYFGLTNCTITVKLASDMAGAIMDYAADIDAGMIAIGTHDRHGLMHLIASHVSKDVLNHAHRPIWTKSIR